MRLEAPFWWYRERGALASALAPLGRLYGKLAEARSARVMPYRSRLPVICIGNFTAGGGGKTPTALAVAALLGELGLSERATIVALNKADVLTPQQLKQQTARLKRAAKRTPLVVSAATGAAAKSQRSAGGCFLEISSKSKIRRNSCLHTFMTSQRLMITPALLLSCGSPTTSLSA